MKKKFALAIGFLIISFYNLRAQQAVLDEIYEDYRATRSDDTSLGYGFLGLLMLAAAIFVIWLIVQFFKKNKDGIKDFIEEYPGCGCMLIIFCIVGFLALIGVIN